MMSAVGKVAITELWRIRVDTGSMASDASSGIPTKR